MFQFKDEKKVSEILSKYPSDKKKSAIMSLLWLAQEQDGENLITREKISAISKLLEVAEIKIYEVASFYTMYNLNEVGKYHIQICGTVPCHLVGSKVLFDFAKKSLGVEKNKITSDGKFSYSEVECLGACTEAPVIQINNKKYFTKLDKNKFSELINKLSDGIDLEKL